MATFLLTDKDGKKYRVDAPDAKAAYDALQKMKAAPPAATGMGAVQGAGAEVAPTMPEDIFKSAGSGLVTGTEMLGGMGGDALSAVIGLGDLAKRKMVGGAPMTPEAMASVRRAVPFVGNLPTSAEVGKTISDTTGFTPYTPRTTAGKYANAAAEFVPSAMAFGGAGTLRGALSAIPKYGVIPGLTSEAAGQLAESAPATAPYADLFRVGGAFLGPGVAIAGRRALTPFPARAENTSAARTLAKEGVTSLTPGQRTGTRSLKYVESEIGGGRVADLMDKQGREFTAAVLRRAGMQGDNAAPEYIAKAFKDIGTEFDALAAQNSIPAGSLSPFKLNGILKTYDSVTPAAARVPLVETYVKELSTLKGPMTGEQYKVLRSYLGKRANTLRVKDPEAANALREIQDVLDDAMEAGIKVNNPDALGAWQDVRRRYRNLLVIDDAAGAGGEAAAAGIITPARLRASVTKLFRKSSYSRGRDDFSPLARAGIQAMTPLPDSGTASRAWARTVTGGIGATLAGNATGGSVPEMLYGLAAGVAAPTIAGRAMLSKPGMAYLANQAFVPPKLTAQQKAALSLIYARPLMPEQFPPMLPYAGQQQR